MTEVLAVSQDRESRRVHRDLSFGVKEVDEEGE